MRRDGCLSRPRGPPGPEPHDGRVPLAGARDPDGAGPPRGERPHRRVRRHRCGGRRFRRFRQTGAPACPARCFRKNECSHPATALLRRSAGDRPAAAGVRVLRVRSEAEPLGAPGGPSREPGGGEAQATGAAGGDARPGGAPPQSGSTGGRSCALFLRASWGRTLTAAPPACGPRVSSQREADIVVLTCTLNPSTRGMVNDEFFAAMKPRALLVRRAPPHV